MGAATFDFSDTIHLVELVLIMTPSIIAAISSMRNGKQINSVDKKLLQTNIQHALNEIRTKSDGENSGACSGSKKKAVSFAKKETLTGGGSE